MKELLYALLVIMNILQTAIGLPLLLLEKERLFNGWVITWIINSIVITFLCWYLIWEIA